MDLVGLDDDYEDEIVKIFVSWQVCVCERERERERVQLSSFLSAGRHVFSH
jgi:hypothetical protein